MAVIYLAHPQHGSKVAISEEEAIYDENFGWMRYDVNTSSVAMDVDAGDEPVNEMAEIKFRGRQRSNR
jgi:hypothetical protein